ncbi:MAG: hypothetical protein HUJ97_00170 [Bacteroidales bacterium]|nr:hypothetical protein [Bacteroidales bacterium]
MRINSIEVMKAVSGHPDYEFGIWEVGGLPLEASDLCYLFFGHEMARNKSKITCCKRAMDRLVAAGYLEEQKVTIKPYTVDNRNMKATVSRYRVKGSNVNWFKKTDEFANCREITLTKEDYRSE